MEETMEHRWSTRIPLSTRVTLYRNKEAVAVCIAKDIGRGGLFVATGPTISYSTNTTLEVDIKLQTEEGTKRFRLSACIIYRCEAGMGLMFLEPHHEFSVHVRRLLLNGFDARAQAPATPMLDSKPLLKRATA
jgi:hypothetical protein